MLQLIFYGEWSKRWKKPFLPKYTGGLFKLNLNFIALSEEAFACQQHLDHWAHVACLELLMGRQGRQRRLMLIIPTCHNVRTTQYHSIPQHQYSTITLYPLYPTTNITLCHNTTISIYQYTTIPLYATMQPQCSQLQNTLPSLWSNFPLSPVTGLLSRTLFSTHLSKTVESGTKKARMWIFAKHLTFPSGAVMPQKHHGRKVFSQNTW